MWHFLKDSYTCLTAKQKESILKIVNTLPNEDNENSNKYIAYQKLIWLSAIKNIDEGNVNSLYDLNLKITGKEPEHPDFSSYKLGSRCVEPKSPYTVEELISLPIIDLIMKLNSYEQPKGFDFDEPNLEGLAKCFKEAVKTSPLKYIKHLNEFINVELPFIYELILAYNILWNDKNDDFPWDIAWESLLDFCMSLISNEDFWIENNIEREDAWVANGNWIAGAISELIESGVKSDEHAFKKELLPKAKHILLHILSKQKPTDFSIDSDPVMIAINSSRGKCIEALINLALRTCRTADKSSNEHVQVWENDFQAIFDDELSASSKGIYEFATLLTNYLPNFQYMSIEWVKNNLGRIFDQSNHLHWHCAMQGYSYVSQIDTNIYKFLRIHGDFIKALDDPYFKKTKQDRIIQDILLAYFNNDEELTDKNSLIHTLFERNKFEELKQIAWFVWTQRNNDDKNINKKIIELWEKYLSIINFDTNEGKELASQLSSWIDCIDRLDDKTINLILAVAPYTDEDHNGYHLLEKMAELSIGQPMEVSQIWLKMLEKSCSDYPQKAVEKIIINLVKCGKSGIRAVRQIADAYLKHGNEIPLELFNKAKNAAEKQEISTAL
jgi:hypothetical protein